MRPTVLLYDIDGTLVTTGGVGRRALERAFGVRYDKWQALKDVRMDGMTDHAIVRAGLVLIGVDPTPAEIAAVLDVYLQELSDEVSRADPATYRLHPGMVESLDEASGKAGVAVGLGTGNIRPGARVKLERVGVFHRFSFGGFGCDHEDRPTLIRIGAERGAEQLQTPLAECRVVVIGDTPKDVHAAKQMGAECVGVGTGSFTPAQLRESGAEHAFANLASPEARKVLFSG